MAGQQPSSAMMNVRRHFCANVYPVISLPTCSQSPKSIVLRPAAVLGAKSNLQVQLTQFMSAGMDTGIYIDCICGHSTHDLSQVRIYQW
jgi:hypothetical protein